MKSIQLTEEARRLSPQLRRCYLTDEPLKYFPVYHRRYCMLECEMKQVALKCKCALLNYPSVLGMPMCGPRQLACARTAAVRFKVCHCPLSCDNEKLIMRHFSFPLTPDTPTYDRFYDDLDLSKVTIIRLYVHGYTKTVYSRRSYFSRHNLFSQLGGVFNIFFGCSILTVLELLFLLRRYIRERRLPTHQSSETWPYTR
ncbi:pickpocket protein 28-like [Pieris rapae]|uniref:pickpocket protein 28-like n=1 Tax=Pieris rapae TaxID=64459 RepID=UPI001E28100B|nr:pickpocket protein 28-like [Pieris rapae]